MDAVDNHGQPYRGCAHCTVIAAADEFVLKSASVLEELRAERRRLVHRVAEIDRMLVAAQLTIVHKPDPRSRRAQIIAYVRQHPGSTAKEIDTAIPRSATEVAQLATLVRVLVRHRAPTYPAGPWRYWPADFEGEFR